MTQREALQILVHTWVDNQDIEAGSLTKIREARQTGESYLETLLRVINIPGWTANLFSIYCGDRKDRLNLTERQIFHHTVRLAAQAAARDSQAVEA